VPRGGSEELRETGRALTRRFRGKTFPGDPRRPEARPPTRWIPSGREAAACSTRLVALLGATGPLYLSGATNYAGSSDLSDTATLRSMLRAFEDKARLIDLLSRMAEERGIQVMIGSENPMEDMRGCSLITSTYTYRDQVLGVLGVVGPRRMPYSEVMSVVDETARVVSSALSRVRQHLYFALARPGTRGPIRNGCPARVAKNGVSAGAISGPPHIEREASRIQAPSSIPAPNPLLHRAGWPPARAPNRLLYLLSAMSDSFFDGPVTNEGAEEVQRLREALEARPVMVEAQQDRYLRTVAEFDNVRKRSARERGGVHPLRQRVPPARHPARAGQPRRAMQAARSEPATSLTTGVELIQRELLRVLEKFGVAPFNSVGQPFDPERHEAIARVPSTDPPGHDGGGRDRAGATSCTGACSGPAMVTVAVAPDDSGSAVDA